MARRSSSRAAIAARVTAAAIAQGNTRALWALSSWGYLKSGDTGYTALAGWAGWAEGSWTSGWGTWTSWDTWITWTLIQIIV